MFGGNTIVLDKMRWNFSSNSFRTSVHAALNNVVYKYEKQQAADKITHRMNMRKQGITWLFNKDSFAKISVSPSIQQDTEIILDECV